MRIFTESDNFTSTVLWKHCLMMMVIAVLSTDVGWAKSMHSESLNGQENDGDRPFVTIWKTDNAGASQDNQIIIPTDQSEDLALVYNYNVYWEEVDNPTNNGSLAGLTDKDTIDFPSPGTYRVEITGQFPKIFFNNEGDRSKILAVEQWGDIVWENMRFAFRGCDEISINATDAPNLSQVTDMWGMFWGSSINQNINHWDVSNVTNMGNFFRDAKLFNQPLDNWDVSNVTLMPQVFMNAENFNQDIDNWDVSKVTNMASMFNGAKSFNRNIGSWNVGNVTQMHYMFYGAKGFNQDISQWNVSNVTNMSFMFRGATNFNQPIGRWDVGKVKNISQMFENAINFNGDISQWKYSDEVVDLSNMFREAISFNQDLSQWDVSNVSNMKNMFYNASSFDQDLSNWDISKVTDITNMLRNSGISPYNYDAILNGWLINGVKDGLDFYVHGLKYCQGGAAREALALTYNWTIIGDKNECSQIITFDVLSSKTYGDPDFKLMGKVSSGAPIIYTSLDEDIAIISSDSVKIIGAGTTTIIASQPGDDYYSAATSISRELKINKADQIIAFEPIPAKTIGDGTFDLVATTNSGLELTFTSSDESVAKVEGNTVAIIGPGTVVITAFQEGNENYHAADPVEQILQVNKKSQSIVFEPIPSKTILDDEFDLTAVASSGLEVVYSSSDEAIATVLDGRVSIEGIGETMITASQPGNEEFEAAANVSIQLSITKVPQEITFEPLTDKLTDDSDFELVVSSSSGLPIAFSVSGPATIEGNSISLKGTPGKVVVTATQGGDEIYNPAEPVIRTFEVMAAPVTGVIDLRKEGITIYPNPIQDRLNIELAKIHQAVIYVSDGGGNVVLEQRLETNSNQVDFSSLSNGLYFIKIQLADKVLYQKVVKK